MSAPHKPAAQIVFVVLQQHTDKAFVPQGQEKAGSPAIVTLSVRGEPCLRGGDCSGKRSRAAPFTVSLLGVRLRYALRDGSALTATGVLKQMNDNTFFCVCV